MGRNFNSWTLFTPTRLIVAAAAAVVLIAGGTGSYISWTATASGPESPAVERSNPAIPVVDVDSLYEAKANEESSVEAVARTPVAASRSLSGRVSWYGPGFHGRRTASGERFDKFEMTAAHKTLPFGTLLRVTDVATGRSVLVRVNDRGPYAGGRILDLSEGAASRLGIRGRGTASTRADVFRLPADGEQYSFDVDGNPFEIKGYGVRVLDTPGYDEAVGLQHKLRDEGRSDVFLTVARVNGSIRYSVTCGLFASEDICSTLLAELESTFPAAGIDHFSPEAQTPAAVATTAAPKSDSKAEL